MDKKVLSCVVSFLVGIIAVPGISGAGQSGGVGNTATVSEVSSGVDVRDFGVVGDGKADDTAAFQRAVDAAVGDIYVPRGVYRLTAPIVILLDKVGPVSIVGNGTGRVVMAGAGPAFKFVGTHEGTAAPASVKPAVWARQRMPIVAGIEIAGANERACGIEAVGTMELIISRVTIREVLHGIHLTRRNRNVIISDSHIYHNRGVGIYLDDVNLHQINISNSHISYNGGGGIVARAGCVRNLQISGCDIEGNMSTVTDGKTAAKYPGRAIPTANIQIDSTGGQCGTAEIEITGCTIQHTHGVEGAANIRYLGSSGPGKRWGYLTIAGNVLSDVVSNIDIRQARGVSITANALWRASRYNMHIVDSSNVVIGPNVLDRNPLYRDADSADDAVLLQNCSDCTIIGLHINGVRRAEAGLILKNCRRINITGCSIFDCDHAGILLQDVTNSRMSGCLIQNRNLAAGKSWVPIRQLGKRGTFLTGNSTGTDTGSK